MHHGGSGWGQEGKWSVFLLSSIFRKAYLSWILFKKRVEEDDLLEGKKVAGKRNILMGKFGELEIYVEFTIDLLNPRYEPRI